MRKPIYLDHHATTPVDPDVLQAMLPYFSEHFGNAMSGSHMFGWTARAALQKARTQVAKLIHAEPDEIIFTSGATESVHAALLGLLEERGGKSHVITAPTEHKCVLEVCKKLVSLGHEVTYLPVNRFGQIDLQDLERAIRPDTALITLMHANNEIGTIHPIGDIGRIARERGVLLHVDAAQTVGREPVDVRAMNIDLLSISAHKFYGPKGSGALFLRQTPPRVHIAPFMAGGGQEKGLRGGTHNIPGIVGLGAAAEKAMTLMNEERARLTALRDQMIAELSAKLDDIRLNGHPTERLCNNVNISIGGISADHLLALHDVAFSSGSACSSGSFEISHVLQAIGAVTTQPMTTIRFGLGRMNTQDEVRDVVERLSTLVRNARTESMA